MPRLIINADDLGVNASRSHGIFQCAEFGILTAASIIANGTDSDAAAKHARERGLSCGLHLNLTEEYPLSKTDQVMSLLEGNGLFLNGEKLRAALDAGTIVREHLEREVRAQIEWIFDTYGSCTNVSGHHGVHIHPTVVSVLIPAMERYGIRFVRIPDELPLPPHGFEIPERQLERVRRVGEEAREARGFYEGAGIVSTDHFRGLTLHGNASLKNLRHILTRLPEGTIELMVHPGSMSAYGTPFDLDPQRQTELRMLTDESIPLLLAERKIELIGWEDL